MRAIAFSGGKDSMACLFLMRDTLDCAIYVDTGFTYPETQKMVDLARSILPVHVVHSDREGQNALEGIPSDIVPIAWTRLGQKISGPKPYAIQSYLGCCYESISAPLMVKAKELGVTELVYGQRNDEAHKAPVSNGEIVGGIVRLQPIENWSAQEVMDYLATKMEIPEHFGIKHSSLDCYDCTAFGRDSKDRVEWTKLTHPNLYAEYSERSALLNDAIKKAMEV
jgi:phosphoadenosine phosphosulfate reductase